MHLQSSFPRRSATTPRVSQPAVCCFIYTFVCKINRPSRPPLPGVHSSRKKKVEDGSQWGSYYGRGCLASVPTLTRRWARSIPRGNRGCMPEATGLQMNGFAMVFFSPFFLVGGYISDICRALYGVPTSRIGEWRVGFTWSLSQRWLLKTDMSFYDHCCFYLGRKTCWHWKIFDSIYANSQVNLREQFVISPYDVLRSF